MILTIPIVTDENIVGNTCDNTDLDSIQFANLGVRITVDDTVIINTVDLATYVFPVSVVTALNSILVDNMGIEDAGGGTGKLRLQINLPNIWDKTNVKVELTKAGVYPYNQVFEVYGYDLGNNNAQNWENALHQNPEFTIELKAIQENINGEQVNAISRLIAYRKPFTNKIFFYNAVTTGGDKIYTSSTGAIISGTNGYVCDGALSISQTNNIYNIINCVRVLVSTCTKSVDVPTNKTFLVPFNTEVNCNDCPEESEECCEGCDTLVEQDNTASTFINYDNLSTYYQNNIVVYPMNAQELVYNLYDYNGALVSTLTYTWNINPPTFVYDFTTTTFPFVIPEVGDYLLEVILTTPDLRTCTTTYKIKNCNWYEVEQTDCNLYKVHNRSFDPITLTINRLNDAKEFELVSTQEIDLLSYDEVTLGTDGIYTFNVTRDTVTYTYIVIVYCNLKQCMLDKLSNLICANENNLCKSKDYYDFNALILNAHTYFAMLNNEYNFNYIYTALTPNKLEELYQINDFITRFEEYCLDCDPNCEDCSKANLTNCKDCG